MVLNQTKIIGAVLLGIAIVLIIVLAIISAQKADAIYPIQREMDQQNITIHHGGYNLHFGLTQDILFWDEGKLLTNVTFADGAPAYSYRDGPWLIFNASNFEDGPPYERTFLVNDGRFVYHGHININSAQLTLFEYLRGHILAMNNTITDQSDIISTQAKRIKSLQSTADSNDILIEQLQNKLTSQAKRLQQLENTVFNQPPN